jgi:hypothetical protein
VKQESIYIIIKIVKQTRYSELALAFPVICESMRLFGVFKLFL